MLGGPISLDQTLRHPQLDDRNRINHHRPQIPGKLEQYGDPYSFVEENHNLGLPNNMNTNNLPPQAKKRGRKKKPDMDVNPRMEDFGAIISRNTNTRDAIMDPKERKRHDRFNGLSEEEVSRRTLPDHLAPNLDIVIVGINPGLFAAYKGHHYAGPGNHFWKCLYLSGLVPEPLTADDDVHLLRHGIGFTNMVSRPTKGSADLTRREIKQGSQVLLEKLQKYQPKVAVFNGKLIFEVFSGKKDFPFGRQSEFVEGTNTHIWVMPSSSARCAQLPRAADKVPFYCALKKFRDYLNGLISELDDSEVVFNESKPLPKSAANGELKKPEPNGSILDESDVSFSDNMLLSKKKRGRPRKGMEKCPGSCKKEKLMKKESLPEINGKNNYDKGYDKNYEKSKNNCFDGMSVMDNFKRVGNVVSGGVSSRPTDLNRKRRGRPKKSKQDDCSTSPYSVGNSNTPDVLENSAPNNNGTCKPPTASSVSSGYSTATSTEERCRREENGSLSNTGSGGPSPSHHSYTTQSDLSSEISAAISCGSAPPSPLNGHAESIFDSLSGVLSQSMDESQAQQKPGTNQSNKMTMSNIHSNQNHLAANRCGASGSLYMNPPLDSHDPSYLPYHHHSYDNRLNSLNNRNQLYQANHFRDGSSEGSTQNTSSYPTHSSYEVTKAFDIASKSLSGLESLVDQIPSIADSEIGAVPPANGGCLPGMLPDVISHSQSLSNAPSSTALSHSGHYGEAPQPGFLPYGPPSSYGNPSHYSTSPFYASDLSSSFPVNSLGTAAAAAAYCTPSPSSGMLLGYSSYHGQYPSPHGGTSYSHSSPASLHMHPSSPYGPPGFPPSYSGSIPYSHANSMSSSMVASNSNAQRYPQRLHLRQEGMDLGHMGFGGY
ncbi:unnamed protein product [Allacma fusca]|uniref:G/T mismatch-specific thymine DNA glycosylase n=1 Tax=Allacma fusca TaxID=39272 RepID=A0A8J2PLI4_9HEXA|nr:unnamed protein product [Allacma fusca]